MPALTVYPAIDLKDGACVRLRRGDFDQATVYSRDPAKQACVWQDAGCRWLHVVDLNGAIAGRSVNAEAVRAILSVARVPVQLGGGIRDLAAVTRWLDAGVRRIVLGSAAVKNPRFVREACRAFPERIALGIDARDGRVAVAGWAETSDMAALDLARAFEDAGAAAIVYTDISRDGMLAGLNVGATADLARRVSTSVIASGGVAGLADLHALKAAAQTVAPGSIEGVIVGRALYDGRLDIAEALRALND